jgi:hypothetical protein
MATERARGILAHDMIVPADRRGKRSGFRYRHQRSAVLRTSRDKGGDAQCAINATYETRYSSIFAALLKPQIRTLRRFA